MSDKTEAPTPRRLRKARDEGSSGASAAASQALAFLVAVAVAPAAVRVLASRAAGDLRAAIAQAAGNRFAFDPQTLALAALSAAVPVLAAAGAAGAAAQLVQTGGAVALGRFAPRLDRLDVVAGLGRLASGQRIFAVVRALVGAAAVAWLAYHDLLARALDVARVAGRPAWTGAVAADVAETFAWHAASVGLVLGLIDALVTQRSWREGLRMTKDEVKREHRDAEGDPLVRAARQRAYHEMLAQAALAGVRTASVVITNPTHLACALRYDEKGGDEAPVVVGSGEGDLAARIARAAEEWGIPVVRDVPLARALVELGVGEAIPEALYEAVAEILRALWQGGPPHET